MAQSGGPEKVGAVSFDVNANLAPAQKSLEDIKTEAGKKGEEAGKAFSEGVAKGAKAGAEATKFTGEGSDVFVGPARPTGKDEAARQWALTQEQAAAGGSVGGHGGGAEADAAAGGGIGPQATALAMVAAARVLTAAVEKAAAIGYEIGKTIGDGLADTRKQMLELDQALRANAASLGTSQSQRDAHYAQITAGNPNIGTAANDRTKFLESENVRLEAELIKEKQHVNETKQNVAEYAVSKYNISAIEREIAENKDAMDSRGGSRRQASEVGARQRREGTFGGRLMEGGVADPNQPIGIGAPLGVADAAAVDDWIRNNREQAKAAAEWQQKSWMQRQEQITEMRRGNLNRKVDQ